MQSTSTPQRQVLSVSQLNRQARQLLETHLPLLWIEGEISNFSRPSSGHWYFTLKDSGAQVRCAMFRNRNMRVQSNPQQGQQVLVRGRVSLYEGRGDYQLIVEHMEEAGHGALQRAFDELKFKLQSEGLFSAEYKQPLPALPAHIGVITSATGAAVKDILQVLQRRFASIPVSIFPVVVQGAQAAPQISQAIQQANEQTSCDLLIVGRGGGSLEDLWAFNEEQVARAIFSSRIPIISAVGHEVDFTIADFVADVRAPTPSAAAEICTPDGEDMLQQFTGYEILLEEAMERKLERQGQRLNGLAARLQHPGQRLQSQAQHLDNLEIRLQSVMGNQLQQRKHRLHQLQLRHRNLSPAAQLRRLQEQNSALAQRLEKSLRQQLDKKQGQLAQTAAVLNSVSPLNTMQRGYSITCNTQQQVIRSTDKIKKGDTLITRLAKGEITSTVTGTNN